MVGHDIVVLGASAGGIEPLKVVLAALPRDLPAALFAVVHLSPHSENRLAESFAAVTPLRVQTAEGNECVEHGQVVIARADHHLVVKIDHIEVTQGPRENQWRPAIDVLFRSAAVAQGPRVIGVILSGSLDDGSAGLIAIKRCGGLALAQEPTDADFPDMPESAIRTGCVDHVLPAKEIGPMLRKLVNTPASAAAPVPDDLKLEADIAATGRSTTAVQGELGELSPFTCAECGGPLWKQDAQLLRFRCLIGHGYTARSLLQASGHRVDSTLWAAVRQFEQRANLQRAMAHEEVTQGREKMAARYTERAAEMEQHATLLRRLLLGKAAA